MTSPAQPYSAADAVRQILDGRPMTPGSAFRASAPVNIALVKYWGKRDEALNLPVTSSLSVSLADLDTETEIAAGSCPDSLMLDGRVLEPGEPDARRLSAFLDLFRPPGVGFRMKSVNRVPTAAGLASSASGFAALIRALDGLFGWGLPARELSILARLGSGSACRSLFDGFVEWRAGHAKDGMDSYAIRLPAVWPELRIGLWILDAARKPMSSRDAMRHTVQTSPLYRAWPETVETDLRDLRGAIHRKDIERLIRIAEGNALAMHATMAAARPPAIYPTAETHQALARIRKARSDGLRIGFTMDAGPNIKLLFAESDRETVERLFGIRTIAVGFPEVRPAPDGKANPS